MRRVCSVLLCVGVLVMVAGCVARSKYVALVTENEKQKEKIDDLGRQVDETRLAAAGLRAQVKGEQDAVAVLRRSEAGQDEEVAVLMRRVQTLTGQVQSLQNAPPPGRVRIAEREPEPPVVTLPTEVVDALKSLDDEVPSLEFDAQAGRCRFTSDVLFERGSDAVQPEFEAVLKKFAAIFTGVGKGLRLRIEGHTDSQRIRNVGTRSAHPTNWHLSAHRAIEVLRALYRSGIDQDRVTVVGYGSHRPIADNRTAAGRSRNRRVEIFVVTPSVAAGPAAEPGAMGG